MSQNTLTDPKHIRYHFGRVEHPDIYTFYTDCRKSHWDESHVSKELNVDRVNRDKLPADVRRALVEVLKFFLFGDGVVNLFSGNELKSQITIFEVSMVYNLFMAQEDIHNIVYSSLCEIYAEDENDFISMFNAIITQPAIREKAVWNQRWSEGASIAQAILCNIIIEGLFFSSSFCFIFWVNQMFPGLLPGLAVTNEWISRDEGTHVNFGILLYLKSGGLEESLVHDMFRDAVRVELDFVDNVLSTGFVGLNADLMGQYVMFVADSLLCDLGASPLYNVDNPFNWMILQSVSIRTPDFFTRESSEYALPIDSDTNTNKICFDDLFAKFNAN